MLDTIYISRHGFRSNWTTDNEGNYSSSIASPTGIASDPPLAAHGVDQARELAAHAANLDPPVDAIFSSPFYRCLETINPLAEALNLPIYSDNGLGEWYGVARFDHPSPARPELLHKFFPRLKLQYEPTIIPSTRGETLAGVHDRVAYAVAKIIDNIDKEWLKSGIGPKSIMICTHAATNIAAGRALTGNADLDVRTGTCSLGKYSRKNKEPNPLRVPTEPDTENSILRIGWRGNGLGGGWDQLGNGDCSFLTGGEERNWFFSGEESWDFPLVTEGVQGAEGGMTAAVEGSSIGGPGALQEGGAIEKRLWEIQGQQAAKEAKI